MNHPGILSLKYLRYSNTPVIFQYHGIYITYRLQTYIYSVNYLNFSEEQKLGYLHHLFRDGALELYQNNTEEIFSSCNEETKLIHI